MKWSETVREAPMKIWGVWNEESCLSSYWSTEERALAEVSRLSGIPKDQLEFRDHYGVAWLVKKDGGLTDPGIVIDEIEVDTGKYH